MKDKSFVCIGLHYGEHGMAPENLIADVKKYGKSCKLAMIRLLFRESRMDATLEQYCRWAEFFRDNKIYFCFLYSINDNDGEFSSCLTASIVKKMYEIAGEYFIGDSLGELGNGLSRDVYDRHGEMNVQFNNMQEAKDTFIRDIKKYVKTSRNVGIKKIGNVESHTMMKYSLEAGVDILYPELLLGNPEHILSFARGASRSYNKEEFGGYIAHEWYGGVRHEDPLKDKRLHLIYRAAYMHGANYIFIESGYEKVNSYGVTGGEDSPYCRNVRKEIENFDNFIQQDKRLAKGPKVKVAFVSGNLDGYSGNSVSYGGVIAPVWGQCGREEWDRTPAEHSWHILDEVYRSCDWHNPINYGDYDYSAAPGYGIYDVISAEAPQAVMQQYEWLIFAGWNTMTEVIYENLKSYVKHGGNLLITAAHMKTGSERTVDSPYIHSGSLEDFLGCNLTGKKYRSNKSYKFARESIAKGVHYPGTADFKKDWIDPIGSEGYTSYAEIEEKGCKKAIFLGQDFLSTKDDYLNGGCVLAENKYGKGNVLFMCSDDYPGAAGIYPLYKIVIKAILAATHRNSDIKVISNDKVRFAVYEDEKRYKVYLLNTDMNIEQKANVIYNERVWEKDIAPCELESVEFDK